MPGPIWWPLAEQMPDSAYSFLERPVPPIKTVPRQRPPRHKARIVQERGFETIHTLKEMVVEFAYRPVACDRDYRLIVLRKKLAIEKRGVRIREEYRYFFLINDREMPTDQAVLTATSAEGMGSAGIFACTSGGRLISS